MKKFILLCVSIISTATLFAQEKGSQTKYDLSFDRAEISSVTAIWSFNTLFGYPVIDGSYKWTGTGKLNPNDFIILKVEAKGDPEYYAFIKIAPEIPDPNGDYGYNMATFPEWGKLFCGYDQNGRLMECFSEEEARLYWKNGFTVVDFKFKRLQ